MADAFVPGEFAVPEQYSASGFRLERLGPVHNERDHEAWMSSIDHIRTTPGFPDGSWPSPMTLQENLADLERHADDFDRRAGFTYSVLEGSVLEGDEVIGCVYIYPSESPDHDASVQSWVRASRAGLDGALWSTVMEWLQRDWPFAHLDVFDRT